MAPNDVKYELTKHLLPYLLKYRFLVSGSRLATFVCNPRVLRYDAQHNVLGAKLLVRVLLIRKSPDKQEPLSFTISKMTLQ